MGDMPEPAPEVAEAEVSSDDRLLEIQTALNRQADRDRLMATIALRIHQSLDLDEILFHAIAEVRQFLDCDRVLIYHFDESPTGAEAGILVAADFAAGWNLEEAIDSHRTWYRREGLTSYEQGQSYVEPDTEADELPADYLSLMQKLRVKAKIVTPIIQGDRLWGVLTVHQCRSRRQWQTFETNFLEQLSTQLAIAIQQAQLFSQVQQLAQREHLLNQIGRALNSSLDPNHVLQEIVDRTGQCFGVDRVLIYTLTDQIRVHREWRADAQVPSLLHLRADRTDWPDLVDLNSDFYQKRLFYTPDIAQLPSTPAQLEQVLHSTYSVLGVPLFIRDRLFGAIALHTTRSIRRFSTDEILLLQQIADQAAIALHNAQSFEYLELVIKARTQQLEQEKLLSEAASRAKTEFLATMSHELRTPLNAIMGLSQILQQEVFGSLNAKQAEYLTHIHSSGEHLLLLINDILDLAKVEAGRETLVLTSVTLPKLCHYCLTLVQEQAFSKGLSVHSQIAPDAQTCVADERRLKQMLLNLLSNAVKFTPAGAIALLVDRTTEGIRFTVTDTGIGIVPENLPLLFQPFCQLDSELNRQYPGTGLGLALTQKLAGLHQGTVTVESQLGVGSRFTLFLPHSLQALPDPLIPDRPLQPRHILLVDADSAHALRLQGYLQAIGYSVERLPSSQGCLQQVRRSRPLLVLLNAQLPDQSGLSLLADLRQTIDLGQIPVVMIMEPAGDRQRFLAAGATEVLTKPLGIVQLETMLLRFG
jgi:signal transduction histidine kinase/CheY-like chemotaxis protein